MTVGDLESIAAAAHNFCLTHFMAQHTYTHPDAIEADLETLEEAIKAYRGREMGELP